MARASQLHPPEATEASGKGVAAPIAGEGIFCGQMRLPAAP
jgi:hypothetical protein